MCNCNYCKARRGEITTKAYKAIIEKEIDTYCDYDKDFAKQCLEAIDNNTFTIKQESKWVKQKKK
jgi:hypothetical protein